MIKVLILFAAFVSSLYAYELQKEYFYTDPTIRSTDLFPDLPSRFEILKIPANEYRYRIDAQVVVKSFELNGIRIDSSKVRYVNFVKKSPIDFTPFQKQLETFLRGQYDAIDIRSITIVPRGYLPSLPPSSRGIFDERCVQKATGTFYVLDAQGLRHYLDYTVDATLPVLHTSHPASRKEQISGFNTVPRPVPFQNFRDAPLTRLPDTPFRFRSNLKAGQMLTQRNIEPMPLVLQNDNVVVEVQDGGVVVEFAATATQEGALYDIITIQKRDGKRSKAKVIGEHRVELQ